MSAAEKALAALEAAGKAATPRPWGHGEGVCGPYLDYQAHDPEWEVNHSGRDTVWLGGGVDESDRSFIPLAVNLSAPLAAVARAAMARPWKSGAICVMCGGIQAAFGGKIEHVDECQFGDLDAALDALEAAAEGVL